MRKKYAIIYLMGGFGNQLFQLCFAKDLEKKNLFVYIDTSNYLQKNKRKNIAAENRELTIPINDYDFKEAPRYLKIIFKLNNYLRNYSFKNYKFLPIGRYNDQNFKYEFKKYNQFVGYWQDIELIKSNEDFLKSKLSKNKYIQEAFENIPATGSTALHVRRRDYLNMKEALNEDYYKESLAEAEKQIDNFFFDIYTDDEGWVKENKIFSNARNLYTSSSSVEDTIKTFANFLRYENYILSNSTFSLIPAILNKNNSNKIFIPDPWFRNINKTMKYLKGWTLIKNQ